MDLLAKIFCVMAVLWLGAMVVGLLIALAPVILFSLGFVLLVVVITFIGRLLGSWFHF